MTYLRMLRLATEASAARKHVCYGNRQRTAVNSMSIWWSIKNGLKTPAG